VVVYKERKRTYRGEEKDRLTSFPIYIDIEREIDRGGDVDIDRCGYTSIYLHL
jgi:hypothetical protein